MSAKKTLYLHSNLNKNLPIRGEGYIQNVLTIFIVKNGKFSGLP